MGRPLRRRAVLHRWIVPGLAVALTGTTDNALAGHGGDASNHSH